ncbi:MAG: dTMP kinase [Synergistaceae bacterium]|jgi:dTMP kinase|nr:dTMP kinase [Synergistaceae bacterium]
MFIVLEGIDGSGKTTQARNLADFLEGKFGPSSVTCTFEPGGWDGGRAFRDLATAGDMVSRWGRIFVFMADRCEHVARVVRPALDEGRIVVCDRYAASTIAYQVFGDPSAPEGMAECVSRISSCIDMPEPDLVLLLDVNVETAERRMMLRGGMDAYDSKGRDFLEGVRSGYLKQFQSARRGRWELIDASGTPEEVFGIIAAKVCELLERTVRV